MSQSSTRSIHERLEKYLFRIQIRSPESWHMLGESEDFEAFRDGFLDNFLQCPNGVFTKLARVGVVSVHGYNGSSDFRTPATNEGTC